MRLTLGSLATFLLPAVGPGHALSAGERMTLIRAAEVLVAGGPHGVSPEQIADNVERFLVVGRSRRAWRVRLLLRCIELSSLPRYRRAFSGLTLAERRAIVVDEWIAGTRIGRVCAKVKNLVVLGAYGDPMAAAQTGYVPVHRRPRFLARGFALVGSLDA